MPKKKTYEEVKKLFEDNNLELLEDEYINAQTPMKYKCKKCNYICKKRSNDVKRNSGCPRCSGSLKKSFEEVKSLFENNGFELLENKYINANTIMKCICKKCNFICMKRCADISIYGCSNCSLKNRINILKLKYDEVYNLFDKYGFELIEKTYINSRTLMKCRCKICNIICKKRSNDIQQGFGCANCYWLNNIGENNPRWIVDRTQIDIGKQLDNISHKYIHQIRKLINNENINYAQLNIKYKWFNKDINIFKNKFKCWEYKKFHVDHIIPKKAFIENNFIDSSVVSENHALIINHISNFQILSPVENMNKKCKYNQKDYDDYINNIFKILNL